MNLELAEVTCILVYIGLALAVTCEGFPSTLIQMQLASSLLAFAYSFGVLLL